MHDVKDSVYKVRLDEAGQIINGSQPVRQGENNGNFSVNLIFVKESTSIRPM